MIEAYAIGVNLSLKGNIGTEIAGVARQFEALNRIIASSQSAVNDLAGSMRGLSSLARGAAESWTQAARAMERAARATREAYAGGAPSPGGAPGGRSSPAAPRPGTGFVLMPPGATLPAGGGTAPRPGTALVPWAGGYTTAPGPAGGGTFPRGTQPIPGALVIIPPGGSFPGGPGTGPIVPFSERGGTFPGGPGTGSFGVPMVPGGPMPGGPMPLNLSPLARPPGTPPAGGAPPGESRTHDAAMAAAGFGALGHFLYGIISGAINANVETGNWRYRLGSMGMTPEQVAEAERRATALQQGVPGMTIPGGFEIIKDVLTTTQNAHEALNPELLRSLSQTAVVLNAQGKNNALHELFQALQGAEMRGALSNSSGELDLAKMQGFLRNVLATTIQTGGRVGPTEILQFIRSGGLGAAMMSDRALFADAIVPILSMGAARAGTGMQAFAQQFSAGKMSDAGANMLLEMGLLQGVQGGTNAQQRKWLRDNFKVGIGQYRIPPNMLVGMNDEATNPRQHPIEFMERVLLPRIDAYNRQHYGAPRDDADRDAQRMATGQALASRIPGGNLLGDVIRNWPLIMREREANTAALRRADNQGSFDQLMATDPRVRMEAFKASLQGLLTALGGPIMDSAMSAIKDITGALNTLSNFAKAHPDLTANVMKATAGVAAFSLAMAALSGVFMVAGPMIRVTFMLASGLGTLAGALGLLGPGSAAGAALSSLPGALGAVGAALAALGPLALAASGGLAAAVLLMRLSDPSKALVHGGNPGQPSPNSTWGRVGGDLPGTDSFQPGYQAPAGRGAPRGSLGGPGNMLPMSYAPPPQPRETTLNINMKGEIDSRTLLQFVKSQLVREGSGPSSGTTGPDVRAGLFGGNGGVSFA